MTKQKINNLHNILVAGINKLKDFKDKDSLYYWRTRCELFNLFSLAVMELVWKVCNDDSKKEFERFVEDLK